MSLIGKEISDFTVQAYTGGEFREVKKSDVLGKWAVFFFYPADFYLPGSTGRWAWCWPREPIPGSWALKVRRSSRAGGGGGILRQETLLSLIGISLL